MLNKLILSLLICILQVSSLHANNTPADTIASWLQSYCNQKKQINGLWYLCEPESNDSVQINLNFWTPPYVTWKVVEEYDSLSVKNAFINFVNSITVADCTANCDTVIYSPSLKGAEYGNPEWGGEYVWDRILSVYIWWGLASSNYDIVTEMFHASSFQLGYFCYLWEQLGMDYFNHILTRVQSDSTYTTGVRIASTYLTNSSTTESDSMRIIATDILKECSTSDYLSMRVMASWLIIRAYMDGNYGLRASIDTLLTDESQDIRVRMDYEIKQQQKNNLLLEFR